MIEIYNVILGMKCRNEEKLWQLKERSIECELKKNTNNEISFLVKRKPQKNKKEKEIC